MFRLLHQFNNIGETTQLNNDQMPEFLCHCERSKCSPPLCAVWADAPSCWKMNPVSSRRLL